MTLRRLGTVFLHHWVLISVLTALLVGVAAAVSYGSTARYRASALLQVQPPVDSNGVISLQDTLSARERAVTITDFANTGLVWRSAAPKLAGAEPYDCAFEQNGQSEFISATCTSEAKSEVAQDANVFAATLQGQLEAQRQKVIARLRSEYTKQIAELRAKGVPASNFPAQPVYPSYQELSIINDASTPSSAYAPRPLRTMAIALVLALIVNGMLAFLLEHVQNRARSTRELEEAIGAPVLATIPTIGRRAGSRRAKPTGGPHRSTATWESRVGAREHS